MAKLPTTIIVTAGLVASLWAAPAYAAELSAGETADTPETVDMMVLSKIGDMTCEYNTKGMLKKRYNSDTTITFKYSGANIKSYTSKFKHGRTKTKTTGTLTYKKGRLTKMVEKTGKRKTTYKYTYNENGKISKYTRTATKQKKIKYSCTYDDNGRLKKRNASGGDKTKSTFAYDAKGNLKQTKSKYGKRSYTFKYSYKYNGAGLPTKKVTTIKLGGSVSIASEYEYTTISVPAENVADVQRQQWDLLNPQVSFSYPLDS